MGVFDHSQRENNFVSSWSMSKYVKTQDSLVVHQIIWFLPIHISDLSFPACTSWTVWQWSTFGTLGARKTPSSCSSSRRLDCFNVRIPTRKLSGWMPLKMRKRVDKRNTSPLYSRDKTRCSRGTCWPRCGHLVLFRYLFWSLITGARKDWTSKIPRQNHR